MNAEFNWWLLIVGLVIGASLTWLVMAETTRREVDVAESERRSEALWIAAILGRGGRDVPVERVEDVLRLHREYLAAPPPDDPAEPAEPAEPAVPAEPVATAAPADEVPGSKAPDVTEPPARDPSVPADPARPD
ncbi:MAG TPA: hypothetical protein VFO78_00800 [Candidatus Limnocylindrales bacterium]|nr:hypothetical protein [Candidatus Limnocylindrales bacterium]